MHVASLPLVDLRPHPHNPRGKIGPADVEDLVGSIRAHGLLAPIVVRSLVPQTGRNGVTPLYEVLAGHRRLVALRVLERDTADCHILPADLALDFEALMLAENLPHRELPPFAAAELVSRLLARAGVKPSDIAASLGKTPRWVAQRHALAQLVPEVRTAWEGEKGALHHWSLAMLEALAEVPAEAQEALLADGQRARFMEGERDVRMWSGTLRRALGTAKWDLEDAALLPKVGSCAACPNHTHAQPDLFGVEAAKAGDVRKATCLLQSCFEAKGRAHAEQQVAKARAEHPDLVVVHGAPSASDRARERQVEVRGALPHDRYEVVKEGAKGAVPAYVVDGKGAGKVVSVRVEKPGRTATPPRLARPEPARPDPKADLRKRRLALVMERARTEIEGMNEPPSTSVVLGLVAALGLDVTIEKTLEHERYRRAAGGVREFVELVWPPLRAMAADTLQANAYLDEHTVRGQLSDLGWLLKALEVDVAALTKRVEEELPDPKEVTQTAGGSGGASPKRRKKPAAKGTSPAPRPPARRRALQGKAAAAGDRDTDE